MKVKDLKRIWKMVVGQSVMYGMELYWDGQENLRRRLQVWMNRGMRRILGCVRTTPVDAMLGELGEKRVEYELDRKVRKWGWRLLKKGKGKDFGEEWKERERNGGCYESGWVGRMMRGVKKHKLEGERWEIEEEREGKGKWRVIIGEGKEKVKERWLRGREERNRDWVVAVSDAGGEGNGMGIGGGWWEGEEKRGSWSLNGGWGLTVMMGEMCGVKVALERVEAEYRGEKRKLIWFMPFKTCTRFSSIFKIERLYSQLHNWAKKTSELWRRRWRTIVRFFLPHYVNIERAYLISNVELLVEEGKLCYVSHS